MNDGLSAEKDAHAPLSVYALDPFPEWVFIRCSCGESPISRVWLHEHWTGDPEAGKATVHALIASQAAAETNACDHDSDCMFDRCGCVIVGCHGRVTPPAEGDRS